MEIKEYSEIIKKTAKYPKESNNFGLAYMMLGLDGEFQEFLMSKYDSRIERVKELGDCYWYLTGLTFELGQVPEIEFSKTTYRSVKKATRLFYTTKGILSEKVKKYYRDNKEIVVTDELIILSKCLNTFAKYNKFTLSEVLETNYNKLVKRHNLEIITIS